MYADYFFVKNIFLACVEPKLLSQTFKGSSGEMGAVKKPDDPLYCWLNNLSFKKARKMFF